MDILLSIGALFFVFIAIGFCIFSHELGHFLAAKWRGMHIDAFSLGFRPFWKKKINGVEYRLGWLPFGGYVELPQVDATDAVPKAADGTELPRAKAIDRIITAVAGPLFNILSGLLIACFVWWIGMPQDSPKMREITVLSVDPAGPEYAAGLRPEDKIVKINGEPFFSTWAQFVSKILFSIGKVDLEVIRDGKPITISYTPVDNPNAPGRLRSEKIAWPFFQPLIPLELVPEKGSPAEKAGIKAGDYVVAIDGMPIIDFDEFLFGINLAGNNPIRMTLRRGDQTVEVTVRPEPITPSPGPEFSRYMTGIYMQPADAKGGVSIAGVMPYSAALAAGLKPGDRLLEVDGRKIASPAEFSETISKLKGTPFQLTYEREGKMHTVTLAARLISPHNWRDDLPAGPSDADPAVRFDHRHELQVSARDSGPAGQPARFDRTDQHAQTEPYVRTARHGAGALQLGAERLAHQRHLFRRGHLLCAGDLQSVSAAGARRRSHPLRPDRDRLPATVAGCSGESALHHLRHTADQPDALRHLLRWKKNLLFDLPGTG